MTTKKDRIIKEWNKTTFVEKHPSYSTIADKVGCFKSYVFKVIRAHKKELKKGRKK